MHDTSDTSWPVFWARYLLHHALPLTRRLHAVGMVLVLSSCALSLWAESPVPLIAGLLLGYLSAFAGHWWVERNQPLTFRHPVRAALCNARLFAVECLGLLGIGGGYEGALRRALLIAPLALVEGCGRYDIGGQ